MHGGNLKLIYLVCFADPLSEVFTPLENITDRYTYISVAYFVKERKRSIYLKTLLISRII